MFGTRSLNTIGLAFRAAWRLLRRHHRRWRLLPTRPHRPLARQPYPATSAPASSVQFGCEGSRVPFRDRLRFSPWHEATYRQRKFLVLCRIAIDFPPEVHTVDISVGVPQAVVPDVIGTFPINLFHGKPARGTREASY